MLGVDGGRSVDGDPDAVLVAGEVVDHGVGDAGPVGDDGSADPVDVVLRGEGVREGVPVLHQVEPGRRFAAEPLDGYLVAAGVCLEEVGQAVGDFLLGHVRLASVGLDEAVAALHVAGVGEDDAQAADPYGDGIQAELVESVTECFTLIGAGAVGREAELGESFVCRGRGNRGEVGDLPAVEVHTVQRDRVEEGALAVPDVLDVLPPQEL